MSAAPKGRVNWHLAREEYVTGDESFSQLATRLGVVQQAVERHAAARENEGCTWGERREIFRKDLAAAVHGQAADVQANSALLVARAQTATAAALVDALVPIALEVIRTPGALTGYEAVKAALSALTFQRRVHGLDRDVRLEISGVDGGPVEHEVALGTPLDEESRVLAQRALEAVFGKTLKLPETA